MWCKVSPLLSYNPTSRQRDPEAGAHLHFHKLSIQRRLFDKAANLFANEHGLLGLFYEYCSDHIAPPGKFWVAPNAVVENGRMRRMDPETEGKERLERFLYKKYGPSAKTGKEIYLGSSLALPEELGFYPTGRLASEFPGSVAFGAPPGGWVLTWEEVEEEYGVAALLDPDAERGVSIVPTKERLASWELECENFPNVPYDSGMVEGLNESVAGVSPYTSVGEDGEFGRWWRCRSLLQAMYLMVYLDFTGGNKVRRCKRPDCQSYYRLGAHESDCCSKECTSVMTSRRNRYQGT